MFCMEYKLGYDSEKRGYLFMKYDKKIYVVTCMWEVCNVLTVILKWICCQATILVIFLFPPIQGDINYTSIPKLSLFSQNA